MEKKKNDNFFEMKIAFLNNKLTNIVKDIEGQSATLEMNEEKESLLVEIQELKQEIEQDIENLKNNGEQKSISFPFLNLKQEFEINNKMILLKNKINEFLK